MRKVLEFKLEPYSARLRETVAPDYSDSDQDDDETKMKMKIMMKKKKKMMVKMKMKTNCKRDGGGTLSHLLQTGFAAARNNSIALQTIL